MWIFPGDNELLGIMAQSGRMILSDFHAWVTQARGPAETLHTTSPKKGTPQFLKNSRITFLKLNIL